jgi:hypothetical protein
VWSLCHRRDRLETSPFGSGEPRGPTTRGAIAEPRTALRQDWWREMRVQLSLAPAICRRGGTADAPARGVGGRKAVWVQFPPSVPMPL